MSNDNINDQPLDLSEIVESEGMPYVNEGMYVLRCVDAVPTAYTKDGKKRTRLNLTFEIVSPESITPIFPAGNTTPTVIAGLKHFETLFFGEGVQDGAIKRAKGILGTLGVSFPKGQPAPTFGAICAAVKGKGVSAMLYTKSDTLTDKNTNAAVIDPNTGLAATKFVLGCSKFFGRVESADIPMGF